MKLFIFVSRLITFLIKYRFLSTYARCEQSSNNQFQYASWSEQKKHHLIKPFIICAPDSYIYDCYTGFQANLNDSDIMLHILRTDIELLRICEPKKTVFILDRGETIIKN